MARATPRARPMLRSRLICLTLLLSLGTASLWAADKPFPGVQQLMSPEEFEASGLDKLSDEELKALDQWLLLYTAGEAAVLRSDNTEVRKVAREAEIRSRIQGDFKGWSGETKFRLENGQVKMVKTRQIYTLEKVVAGLATVTPPRARPKRTPLKEKLPRRAAPDIVPGWTRRSRSTRSSRKFHDPPAFPGAPSRPAIHRRAHGRYERALPRW